MQDQERQRLLAVWLPLAVTGWLTLAVTPGILLIALDPTLGYVWQENVPGGGVILPVVSIVMLLGALTMPLGVLLFWSSARFGILPRGLRLLSVCLWAGWLALGMWTTWIVWSGIVGSDISQGLFLFGLVLDALGVLPIALVARDRVLRRNQAASCSGHT